MDKILNVNIEGSQIMEQYEKEHEIIKPKFEFSIKNYLQARLTPTESNKTMTIRLLPFSPDGGSPFKKVYIHTVKVNKEVSPSTWKTFICPVHNHKGDKCPFCEVSEKSRELKFQAASEIEKKKYGDIEFMNRPKAAWVVRCIERGHEEDGPKFWLFNDSRKGDGIYDKIINIYLQRKEAAERRGKECNIFDLNEGKDLIITLSKDTNGKTVTKIVDDDEKSPLSEDFEQGMSWINNEKTWDQVYTVKPYNFMSIIVQGETPVWDKEKACYVSAEEKEKADKEAYEAEMRENFTEQSSDFSTFINKPDVIATGSEDSLPF